MGFLKKVFATSNKKKEVRTKQEINETSDKNSTLMGEEAPSSDFKIDVEYDQVKSVSDSIEQILASSRQLDELKVEYQAVTSYLTDIQKIEQIPSEEREQLNDTARTIITLNKERSKYQNSTKKISDIQFKHISKYEDVLQEELEKMKENELYHNKIKIDMQYLEAEKSSLYHQIDEIKSNQSYLKKISMITCCLIISLFILFLIVQNTTGANIQIPFLMTVVMGLISSVYIFMNANTNKKDIIVVERKLNRAITLLNKVKIKYINNTNVLEYAYQKFIVNSYSELSYLWEQYLKAKEEEKYYKKNTEQLEAFHRELIADLRNYLLADPDIWIYQVAAIVDDKEMVEVRHRLNVRRQKLRELIDTNNLVRDRCIQETKAFLENSPEQKEEVINLLKRHGINL